MPHLQLEYSANIPSPPDLQVLFKKLHGVLHEKGGIRLENCKSRARIAEDFFVGSGHKSYGFVHLDIRFLEGRAPEVKKIIGLAARDLLLEWFNDAVSNLKIQITVEIGDIERDSYFKYPEGTLTRQ